MDSLNAIQVNLAKVGIYDNIAVNVWALARCLQFFDGVDGEVAASLSQDCCREPVSQGSRIMCRVIERIHVHT